MTVETLISEHRFFPGAAMAWEAIPFPYLEDASIVARRIDAAGVRSALVLNQDYALDGNGAAKLGRIRALRPFAAADQIEVRRATALRQRAKIKPHEPLPADAVERQLDRHTLSQQEIDRRLIDTDSRALLAPEGETLADLPNREARKDRLSRFDGAGNLATVAPLAGQQALVSLTPAGVPVALSLAAVIPSPSLTDFDGGLYGVEGSGQTFDGGIRG